MSYISILNNARKNKRVRYVSEYIIICFLAPVDIMNEIFSTCMDVCLLLKNH